MFSRSRESKKILFFSINTPGMEPAWKLSRESKHYGDGRRHRCTPKGTSRPVFLPLKLNSTYRIAAGAPGAISTIHEPCLRVRNPASMIIDTKPKKIKPMIYSLGTDISKQEFTACLQRYNLSEQTHQVLARKSFANTPSGFKACMRWVARHTDDPAPLRVTMEATGVYYEALALYIHEHHRQVHLAVVLPSTSKKYIKSRGLRSKTDKIDAYGLALMGAERKLSAWGGIDPFWRRLRAMTRTRTELMDERTALRNRLHALRHSGVEAKKAIQALEYCIQALTQQIDALYRRICKALRAREKVAEMVDYLRTIPGVGLLTIAVVLAETAGFERFQSISQLISYSGYDVKIRESGTWVGQPKISKQGSKYIRRAMYMPASTAIRSGAGPLWEFYQRLRAKHDNQVNMKAHVAVQKKLLRYMYVLWNKQQAFDPQHIRRLQAHHNNVAPSRTHSEEATVDPSQAAA